VKTGELKAELARHGDNNPVQIEVRDADGGYRMVDVVGFGTGTVSSQFDGMLALEADLEVNFPDSGSTSSHESSRERKSKTKAKG